jgi:hypothetical protein
MEPPASSEADTEPGDAPESVGAEQQRQGEVAALLDAYERISPAGQRRDGWTPFLRKLFLQVIADTGRLTLACEYTGLTRQSAYALATRDPLFAAGWDAAAMFARRPVNDTMTEQALEGITETITRPDGVVVTRHRFDTRLSIAVLNRLDKRCDRAEERGDKHLAVMRSWDEWLDLIGKGDDQAAQAILDGAQDCQDCQLPESANPTAIRNPPGYDVWESVWRADDGHWMTIGRLRRDRPDPARATPSSQTAPVPGTRDRRWCRSPDSRAPNPVRGRAWSGPARSCRQPGCRG